MITNIWSVTKPTIKWKQNYCLFYISQVLRVIKSISHEIIFQRLRERPRHSEYIMSAGSQASMLPGCWGWGSVTSKMSTWGPRSGKAAEAWPSQCECSPPSVPRTGGALHRAGPAAEALTHLLRKQMNTYKGKCIACIFSILKNFKHTESVQWTFIPIT